jgi:hypothetical protein
MQLTLRKGVLVVLVGFGVFGLIWMAFGFGHLTRQAKRRNTTGSVSTFEEKAQPCLDAAVKLTLDLLGAVEPLKVLHVEVTKPGVIQQEFLLRHQKIFVPIGKDLHIEDFCEMVGRARSTGTVSPTHCAGRSRRQTGNEVGDTVFGQDWDVQRALDLLFIGNQKPHRLIVPTKA